MLKPVEREIVLPRLNIQQIEIELIGDSSLICHKWSEKAKKMLLGKQMKQPKQAREARNPKEEYKASLYEMPDGKGYGFPAVGFKCAAVDACSHIAGITKVEARGAFHIVGELVKINGKPNMREDMVRLSGVSNVASIAFRGEFKDWTCKVLVRYNSNVLSAEQIVNLFNTAGFAIGVGEWRPQKDGSHGMFHVKNK